MSKFPITICLHQSISCPSHMRMAAHTDEDPNSLSAPLSDDESLCDEQIQALLRGAEGRLRQNSSVQLEPFSQESPILPPLNANTTVQPCIGFTNGAAQVDPLYLRKQQGQDLRERVRMVEPLSARKERLKQVCTTIYPPILPFSALPRELTIRCRKRKPRPAQTGSTSLEQILHLN
jgi:hypothetical protein